MNRILIVRADRLGDVVLSTPVFEAVKNAFPEAKISALVRSNVMTLLKGLPHLDEVWDYDPEGRHRGVKGFSRLIAELKARNFDAAVVLQSQRRIALAILLAGIPVRVGPWSKPHSFLAYNRGLRQHRSRVEMHEADYNLALLSPLGIRIPPRSLPTRIALSEPVRAEARSWLTLHGVDGSRPLIAIHPGMGGSALNWPEEYYLGLARKLLQDGLQVLVTGGVIEAELLKKFAALEGIVVYGGRESKGLDFLAGLFTCAQVVVAPSTGPLHVAVALGKPVVTFYPPIRVQSARRWGPYVADQSRASVLVPAVPCDETYRCRRELCKSSGCMRTISVETADHEVRRHL